MTVNESLHDDYYKSTVHCIGRKSPDGPLDTPLFPDIEHTKFKADKIPNSPDNLFFPSVVRLFDITPDNFRILEKIHWSSFR